MNYLTYLKSKTLQFAILLALLGVVEMNLGLLAQYMSQQAFGLFSLGVGVAVALLRIVTTVPLSQK